MANFYYHRWTGQEKPDQYPFPQVPPFPDANGSTYWSELPEPSKYTFNLAEIDADTSGRLEDGTMERKVLTSKRSLNFEWPAIDNTDISTIYSALATTPGAEYSYFLCLAYPDAATGDTEAKVFYCGDRSTPAYSFNQAVSGNGSHYWSGLTVNFIER